MALSSRFAVGDTQLVSVDEHIFNTDRKTLEAVSPDLVSHDGLLHMTDPFERGLIIDKFLGVVVHNTLDMSDLSPRSCFDLYSFFAKWAVKTQDRETDPTEKFVRLVVEQAKEGNCVWAVPFAFYSLLGDTVAAVHLMNEGKGSGDGWPVKLPKWLAGRMPRPWVAAYENARAMQVSAKDWDKKVTLGEWFDQYHQNLAPK